jgi:hypothetical protein
MTGGLTLVASALAIVLLDCTSLHGETLASRRARELFIENDDLQRRRLTLGSDDSGSELKRVSRAQGVHADKAPGSTSHHRDRLHLIPAFGK